MPEADRKLQDCTYRALPLCAGILLIFSVGAGLAYAFTQQPLPKDAVVGVSLTFLALGVFFVLGCLKMVNSTHISHIPRLEPVRNAYNRLSRCPAALQQRLSRLMGSEQNGERDVEAENVNEFLRSRPAVGDVSRPVIVLGTAAGGTRDEAPYQQHLNGQDPVETHQYRDSKHSRSGGIDRSQQIGKSYDMPLHQANRPFATQIVPPVAPPDTSRKHSSNMTCPNVKQPHNFRPPSDQGSITHTPDRMLRTHAIGTPAGRATPSRARHRTQQQHDDDDDHPADISYRASSSQPIGITPFPPLQETTPEVTNPLGIQQQHPPTNIHMMVFAPQSLGQDVFHGLETEYHNDKLTYEITRKLMPKTQGELKGEESPGLILPRSSSRGKTAPVHTFLRTEESFDKLSKVEGRRVRHEGSSSPVNPAVEDHGYNMPLPAFVRSSTLSRAGSICHDEIAPRSRSDEGGGFVARPAFPKQDWGRSLTTSKRRLYVVNDTAGQNQTDQASEVHGNAAD